MPGTRDQAERWLRGRKHRTRNAACGQPYRGFESHPLRHSLTTCAGPALTPAPSPYRRHAFRAGAWLSPSKSRGHGFFGKRPMFAIVRTGGKQYRVAAGDKIVVEKLAG